MIYVSVRSETVLQVGYDDDLSVLGVRYAKGPEYHYYAVPRSVFDDCLTATSIGRYLQERVKSVGYPYKRVR
jgi:hypothetical protein